MKWTVFVSVLAVISVGGVLGSCKEQKQSDAQSTGYDLSAASNEKYLTDNAAKPGVTSLPSGLQYRVIKQGSGKSPAGAEDMVTVTYKGTLIDGRIFDQTPPGQTATFPAGHLIAGWVEALSLMKEGDEWELVIPSALGYGPEGAGTDIPPNSTLVFDLALISVGAPQQ
jgi:FKBP-type peptidyl-prolyl cis-trans isomerase FklB